MPVHLEAELERHSVSIQILHCVCLIEGVLPDFFDSEVLYANCLKLRVVSNVLPDFCRGAVS